VRFDTLDHRPFERLTYAYAVVIALGLGYFLWRMPFQFSDNLANVLVLETTSFQDLLVGQFYTHAYLRPLLWGQAKLIFDLSGGHHFAAFRLFQIAQLVLLFVLVARFLHVRSGRDLVVVPATFAILVGMHTFDGAVREAFPVNHFLTILICCLAACNLAASRPGWWKDGSAVLLLAYAALTIESGLLVWVTVLSCYLVGWRGISWRGVAGTTAFVGFYFFLRYVVLDVGTPGLIERSSGYGWSTRDPDELVRLFGANPLTFYAYNVSCSVATVLFAEPRGGVWIFTRELLNGSVPAGLVLRVATSCLTTGLVAWSIVRRARDWRGRELEHADRVLLLLPLVLVGNAVLSFGYTKDVIMSPAGVLYGVAAAIALRDVLRRSRSLDLAAGALVAALLLVVSSGWTVRALGLEYQLRRTAFVNRNDWALWPADWLAQERVVPGDRRMLLVARLRTEVLETDVPNPHLLPRWVDQYFGEPY
jgi:hypothetical protein